ncbi:hypothetical protein IMG5_179030 [Ichthyophthirius multifiliis]|uniref:non-specific serine/threonine protein kinase n=1 Tax=Ichthyophthirius multifiliis TaxID=5932 RepID=G0R2K2_ICHMU|nr:hypothetical protein IMG5_179030 [Ichthyophthirius multifiliis]EGR28302.1 hypothetical protein IMG5_179030 [Ichthyophthirius multifiliis]|eukprot:XP_004027647.1 hypothetical protein IMG5_179030 [Ichthyophthirius multifiliis]
MGFFNQKIYHLYQKRDINNYIIQYKIGEGKFSDVYKGYNIKEKDKPVAIKILRPNDFQKIYNEIIILQQIQNIQNALKLIEVVIHKETLVPYKIIPRLNERDIRFYSYILLETIQKIHQLGIIHRDIKFENIIINHEKRKLRIVDWGLSSKYQPERLMNNRVGTVAFRAPEMLIQQNFEGHFSPAIDIWAAGVCISGMCRKTNNVLQ